MALRVRLPALFSDSFVADDDRALVQRFAESRDEVAFTAIVARHARMVYGVCRRTVRDAHLAEDAFQAVFLVLAKNPRRAGNAKAVGGWLFGVARRVGLAARRREERYAKRQSKPKKEQRDGDQSDFDDLLRVLDEELAALPDEFRAPLVACFLEERTLDEAAKQLGWSVSTVRRRLDRAKELLRTRLTRRGATLAGGLFAGFLVKNANAAVPARLLGSALPSASLSPQAAALAAEIGRGSMTLKSGLAAVVVALGLGGLAMGFGRQNTEPEGQPPTRLALQEVAPAPRAVEKKWATIKGRVVFPEKREIPAARVVPVNMIKDFEFFGFQAYRDVLIDPETRGIANAVVWLRPDSDDKDARFSDKAIPAQLADAKPIDRSVLLTREGFDPRVLAARAGDRIVFSNRAEVVFNVRYKRSVPVETPMDWETGDFNVLVPPGRNHMTRPLPALRASDTVSSMIHPWIEGRVWVFDHPYFAVTDATGSFDLKDAPPGKWRLVVWHEKAGYRDGAKGRLGERIEIAGATDLKPIALESANWDKE